MIVNSKGAEALWRGHGGVPRPNFIPPFLEEGGKGDGE